jgi:23S rRNA pseudouridine955/2504/2580 synthase
MAAGFRGEAPASSGRRDSARPASPERRPGKPKVAAPAPKEALPAEVRIETVDAERAGQRLDNFLSTRLKGVPKSAVYRVLRTGQVRVNGKRAKPETRLEGGDQVRIPPMRVDEPGAPQAPSDSLRETLAERVIAEDSDFIVLDKPRGLAAHGGSGVSLGAIEALRAIRPHQEIELVHRLDRDTSGILLLAKKHSALRKVQQMIRESKVEKRYFALLKGSPARDRFEVDAALKKNQLRGGERMVEVDEDDGKPSLSRFKVIQRYADCTLVEVQIITGRTHQIRVHALHAGHPLAGDPKYGDEAFNAVMKARGLKRLFLHAHSLRFPWGEHGAERHYTAPLAAELKAVLEVLTA